MSSAGLFFIFTKPKLIFIIFVVLSVLLMVINTLPNVRFLTSGNEKIEFVYFPSELNVSSMAKLLYKTHSALPNSFGPRLMKETNQFSPEGKESENHTTVSYSGSRRPKTKSKSKKAISTIFKNYRRTSVKEKNLTFGHGVQYKLKHESRLGIATNEPSRSLISKQKTDLKINTSIPNEPLAGATEFSDLQKTKRAFFKILTEFNFHCNNMMSMSYEGYKICQDYPLDIQEGSCIVYSFGNSKRVLFEDIFTHFHCEVHILDESLPGNSFNSGMYLHKQYQSLTNLMSSLNHQKKVIDLVKIDIMDYEWSIWNTIAVYQQKEHIKQLIIEVHFNGSEFNSKGDEMHYYQARYKWLMNIRSLGFRQFFSHYSADCCDHESVITNALQSKKAQPQYCCYQLGFINEFMLSPRFLLHKEKVWQ